MEEDVTHHFNILEPPLPMDNLGQVWLNWPSGSSVEDF